MRILIRGVHIEGGEKRDVLVEGGKIQRVAPSIKEGADETYDLDGAVILPSLVDLHAHSRQPGGDEKETLKTFSLSAVHGGVTAVCTMPNTNPVVDNPAVVRGLREEAQRIGLIDLLPVASITVGQKGEPLTEMAGLKQAGAVAVSEDGLAVKDSRLMRYALEYARSVGLLVMLHCEDARLSDGGSMNEGFLSLKLGLRGIPEISETIGLLRDLEIATYVGARVHICHVSLARSVEILSRYKRFYPGLITAEATPHHLIFNETAVSDYDPRFKMNPPLRRESDRKALVRAIRSGKIDCVATDHAPHTAWEKEVEFELAPFGVVGLETWLSSMIDRFVLEGILSWQDVKRLCCDNPRRILGMEPVSVKEGSIADLVVVDPNASWQVREDTLFSKGKNSPFLGENLRGKVLLTLRRGRIVFKDV